LPVSPHHPLRAVNPADRPNLITLIQLPSPREVKTHVGSNTPTADLMDHSAKRAAVISTGRSASRLAVVGTVAGGLPILSTVRNPGNANRSSPLRRSRRVLRIRNQILLKPPEAPALSCWVWESSSSIPPNPTFLTSASRSAGSSFCAIPPALQAARIPPGRPYGE